MTPVDGALARAFDFGEVAGRAEAAPRERRPPLRLASAGRMSGPGKYKVLEARRRRAQRQARHLLDLLDAAERGR
jgi:hypothetical protein